MAVAMIILDELKGQLSALAHPLCAKLGLELVELAVRRQGREFSVQVFTDRPTGGITLEECTDVNRGLGELIDQSGVLPPEEYSLEVSSPGLDRPLHTRKDFLRVVNQEVRFMLNGAWQGKHEYTGILTEITDINVVVHTEKYGIIEIPIENIVKALVVL